MVGNVLCTLEALYTPKYDEMNYKITKQVKKLSVLLLLVLIIMIIDFMMIIDSDHSPQHSHEMIININNTAS